jgi:hypothetical protein
VAKDPDALFADPTNAMTSFLGGRVLYAQLKARERKVYWGKKRLVTLLRQGMILHALAPLSAKLDAIVVRVRAVSGSVDPSTLVHTMLTDPTILTSLMGFMESPATMRQLVTCLKTFLEGVLPDVCPAQAPTTAAAAAALPTDATNTALDRPGQFLKATRVQRATKPPPRTHVSELLSTLTGMLDDETALTGLSQELQDLQPLELQTMFRDVQSLLGSGPDLAALLGATNDDQGRR